jgi:peptidoglycan/xylan/chitin deacetylase (PgdA/CDA1 family)
MTRKLLDLLAEHGAKATFFLKGCARPGNDAVLDRLVAEGHELGCHAQDHRDAWKVLPGAAIADIRAGYREFSDWIRPDAMFRPPYGKLTLCTWWELRRRGAPLGWWTIVSGDTDRRRRDWSEVTTELRAAGGGVVLMHDLDLEQEHDEWVLEATRALLETARSEGYAVRTLGEVMRRIGG